MGKKKGPRPQIVPFGFFLVDLHQKSHDVVFLPSLLSTYSLTAPDLVSRKLTLVMP